MDLYLLRHERSFLHSEQQRLPQNNTYKLNSILRQRNFTVNGNQTKQMQQEHLFISRQHNYFQNEITLLGCRVNSNWSSVTNVLLCVCLTLPATILQMLKSKNHDHKRICDASKTNKMTLKYIFL